MTQTKISPGPLAGLNVIDFGHYYAGPMAGMLLADQGANVIRVVRPGERELPEPQYRLFNRNKKLLTLDLKTDKGKQQALLLIEKADVLIENFRPGVMQRLGLDYRRVKKKNPGLVYLSLPGFASTDKKRAHIQAWEGVLSAAACVYREIYLARYFLKYPPKYTPLPQGSAYGAYQGSVAVMAALLARRRKGVGCFIETPLVEAGLSGFSSAMISRSIYPGFDQQTACFYSAEDTELQQARKVVKGQVAFRENILKSPLCMFWPCADGRHLLLWGPYNPFYADNFFRALGLDRQLKSEGFIWDLSVPELDCNVAGIPSLNPQRLDRLMTLVGEKLVTKPAETWEQILAEAGVPCAMIRTREEWLGLKPMQETGLVAKLPKTDQQPELVVPGRFADVSGPGDVWMANCFLNPEVTTVSEAHQYFGDGSADKWRNNTDELKKSELLEDLDILDLANIVAGPTATHTLAQYGAQVTKVDPPGDLHEIHVFEANQGKRSVLLNIKTSPGQAILRSLLRKSDVVIHNSLDDCAHRLGLNHEQLQRLNPALVNCQLTAFGGTLNGGWELRKGFDPVAPAATGGMAELGSLEYPEVFGGMSGADINAGLSLAFSALLGVWQQRRTGYGGHGRTSLVRSNSFFQLPFMIGVQDDNGNINAVEYNRNDQGIYQCRDSWLYVAQNDVKDYARLKKHITGRAEADHSALQARFLNKTADQWFEALDKSGISCHPVRSLDEIFNQKARTVPVEAADETAHETTEILRWSTHPLGQPLGLDIKVMAPSWVRVGEAQSYKRLAPTVKYGSHSREILTGLGYGPDEMKQLEAFNITQSCQLGD